MNKDLQALCRMICKTKISEEAINKVAQHVGQMMLLLGSNPKGVLPDPEVWNQLNQSMIDGLNEVNCLPAYENSTNYSFHDVFSGKGYAASTLRNQLDLFHVNADDEYWKKTFSNFDYKPTTEMHDVYHFTNFLQLMEKELSHAVPTQFMQQTGNQSVEELWEGQNFLTVLSDYPSGFYLTRQPTSDHLSLFEWTFILKIDESTLRNNVRAAIVVLPGGKPTLFFYHSYEECWLPWDGKTYIPGVALRMKMEYFKAIENGKLLHSRKITEDDLVKIRGMALEVFKDKAVMPERDHIFVGNHCIGEFTQYLNVAHISGVGKNIVLTAYASEVNDAMFVNLRFIRPVPPGTDYVETIDQANYSALPDIEQLCLLQRTYFSINLWLLKNKLVKEQRAQ